MHAVGKKLVLGEGIGSKLIPPSGSLEVFKKMMKAGDYYWRMNKEGNILARQEIEEAIALDPEYSVLYTVLAFTHLLDLLYQSSESPLISFAQANKNITKALELDDEDYYAHLTLGYLYLFKKEFEKAIVTAERAISINPNGDDAYALIGILFANTGKPEEGIKLIKKALRLNPIPPAAYLNCLSHAYYLLGRYGDAIEAHKKAIKRSPNNLFAHIGLTATYSASSRQEEARHQAERVLELDPTFSLDKFAETIFIKDKAQSERYITYLRKAGLK